jgi:hypothetical protein
MAQSTRYLYTGVGSGVLRQNFNWGPIRKASAVLITACEWRTLVSGVERPNLNEKNIVWVTNIGPHDDEGGGAGGVEFLLHASLPPDHQIDVMCTFTVLGDVE